MRQQREAVFAEMGVAIKEDGETVGFFQPKGGDRPRVQAVNITQTYMGNIAKQLSRSSSANTLYILYVVFFPYCTTVQFTAADHVQ